MVQTLNFISLSSQQAPNDVDWPGLVKAGVQGALIRLGHGIIRDPCASGHIAKAKQYGLYWHGYHTYEGVVNEPQFTIKNATDLGLSNSQYYFVDLAKSSDPFNDYYALHATWLSQGYSTGLLISNDDYLSKFKDSEVIASGTLRWLISDTEPADYDVWQYSSEGTVGISSVKVGFNFSKTDKLKYNLDTTLTGADINKDPYNPETPVGGAYIGWGYDTTGLGGGKTIGYSTDGKNFYALIGPDGLIVRKNDGNRIYGIIADQIDSAISANVIPAKSAADSAVSAADAAVASAQVTSDAVTAIASATAEAKQGANEAMSRAESAWDVATGAKEAVTDFDPLLKSAQSDAKQASETATSAYEQSRSAYDAVKADSSAVVAMQSSMAGFREDVASAQSVADSAKADAGKALTQIADTASALSDAKAALGSDVAEAKNLASTAQTTADNAVKSASSVASDLTAVASQAKANTDGISKVTSDVGLLQTTVADNSGNISKIQETATQIQQAVSDNSGAIVVAKQTADSAVTVASDAKSNVTVAVQTASGAIVTAKNAQGDATTAITTANSAVIQASDAKSNATVAVQTASEASLTAANAKGDASIAKQTASDASVQIQNAQGDISKLQTRAGAIETSVANNSGAIADVQATANQLKASVSDNAGNITIAKQTADSAVTVASDAKSNATVASQTASQASITAQNASGQAANAVLTANGAMTTASDAKSDATVAIQTASGASLTATNAQGDASIAKQTASEAKVQASNAESDFAQLSVRANKIETNVANNSGAIASVQQTANGLTTTVADITSNGGGRNLWISSKSFANTNVNAPEVDWNTDSDGMVTAHITGNGGFYGKWQYIYANNIDPFAIGDSATFSVEMKGSGTITIGRENNFQKAITLTSNWTRYAISGTVNHTNSAHIIYNESGKDCDAYVRLPMVEKGTVAHDWSPAPEDAQNQFTQIKQSINGVATIINDPKTGLNAIYQTAAGNATTISNVKSDVYQLQTTANGLTSRVGNLESKTNTQETEIQQNKNAITLKADQTDVNTLKGNVTSLQAEVTTQANEITTKVTQSDVTGMLTGYATQDYTQSLVTQKANDWNLNLTSLKTDVNAIKTNGGGVNLLQGTRDFSGSNWLNLGTIWKKTDETYNGLSVVETTSDWSGIAQYYQVKQGETYTFSLFARYTSGTGTSNFYIGLNSDPENGYKNAQVDNGALTCSLDTNRKKYSITFTAKADGYIKPRMERTNANTNPLRVCGFMLEKGTVAHDWQPSPSDMATVTSVTNLSATVDGIQAQVYNSDGSSKITQLSNVVQSKVSQGDYNSQINQLKNDINLRVQKGNVVSQINQEAGGNTLIQVSNGKGSFILNADNTIMTGKAWIPVAAIADLTADQIQAGTLKGVKVDFRDSTGTGMIADGSTLTFDVSNTPAGYLSYNGMPVAEIPDGSGGNELAIRYGLSAAIIPNDNSGAQATFSGAAQKIGYMTGTNQGKQMLSGLEVHSNNHHWFGAVNSDATWNRIEINSNDGVNLAWHDQTHFWISDGKAKLYKDNNDSQTATELEVHGWAWVNGWVEAAGHSQHSTLSSKTRIEEADPDYMLDLVNNTDLTTFAFKSEVAEGLVVRHIGPIIDDVNDVAQYRTPAEFIAPTKTARDDDNMIGALFGAVQALTKRIKKLEDKLNG